MLLGVETAVFHKADGIVFGALQDNKLDLTAMRHLVHAARQHDLKVTCHRAFDAASNPNEALEMLIDLGVSRVLTSGTPWGSSQSVLAGIPVLIDLIQQAGSRIEIVLGGGIHLGNVPLLLKQLPLETGSLSIHAYSGVLRNGVTSLEAVRQLVEAANTHSVS
jgi:copper homeostasis protein